MKFSVIQLMATILLAPTLQAQVTETEPNGSASQSGTKTISITQPLKGSVCQGTPCFLQDIQDFWVIADGSSGGFTASWSPIVSVTLQEYSTTARNTSPVNIPLSSGSNVTLNSSRFYTLVVISTIPNFQAFYSIETFIDGAFDVSQAIFMGNHERFSVAAQADWPYSLAFNNDGTKMFVLGERGDYINEYTLSTAFDVATATFAGDAQRFSVTAQEVLPVSLAFNNNGTKMFVLGFSGDYINEYTLSTNFDVATATFAGNDERLSINAQEEAPISLAFNNDGTKMFVMGPTGDDINEYSLSNAFDVSTAEFDGEDERFSVATQETVPVSLSFNSDGTKMFVLGYSGDYINEYTLSTNFDVSTASFAGDDERFSVAAQESSPYSLAFNHDGTKMFVMGTDGNDINQYSLAAPVISQGVANQTVNDYATVNPFASITVQDPNGDEVSATIVLDDYAKGVLTGTGLSGGGPYTLASTDVASLQASLRALVFSPTANRSATSEITTFTLTINDDSGRSDTDHATTVVSSAVAPAVTISSEANSTAGVFTVTFSFSEVVTDFVLEDITVGNGTASDFVTTSASLYEVTITPDAEGTITIDVAAGVAQDAGSLDNTAADQFSITAPYIEANQSFELAENTNNQPISSGNGVGIISVEDDGLSFQDWTIVSGNEEGIFSIINWENALGEIYVTDNTNLDYEETTSYALNITVSDGTYTGAAQTVIIHITDVNDNDPVVTASQSYILPENVANNTVIGSVQATDADVTPTTFSGWTIISGNSDGIFEINPTNGEIVVFDNTSLDRETTSSYSLEMTVNDGINTSQPELVTIRIDDVNDTDPIVTPSQSFNLLENAANNTVIGLVLATDADVTPTTFSEWAIISGNSDGIFKINSASGEITVLDNTNLDWETTSIYNLEVTVSDGINTSQAASVIINIDDVSDQMPVINGLSDITLNEDTPATIDFQVSDPDNNAGELTLNLRFDHDEEIFQPANVSISGTGQDRQVTLIPNEHRFGETQMEMIVNDGELSSSVTFNVTVLPVNDKPLSLSLSNQRIAEEVLVGYEVGIFSSQDIDENDTHTYMMVDGDGDSDNEAFTVSGNMLLTNQLFDLVADETRSIRVRSQDLEGAFVEDSFVITLEANPDEKVIIKTSFTPNGDGVNDTWEIDNINLHQNARVAILNRGGKTVFESRGYETPWDGTFKGKDLPFGTYYYVIDLGGNQRFKGFVMLLK